MPRRVDHAQRRRQIAEALWRLAAGGGLESTTAIDGFWHGLSKRSWQLDSPAA